MINLLPPDIKQGYRFARHNHTLAHWLEATVVGMVGLAVITIFGTIYINSNSQTYTDQANASSQQLHDQKFESYQSQVNEISNNLKLVVKVLSREVLFSQLLDRLSSVLPSDTILTNLSILQTTGGIDITARTANYTSATQLQVNLADPDNQIFSKADIQSIVCASSSSGNDASSKYPCTVTIRALFASNNPFLFINSKPGASK
ncbi:MAG: PilN domain-containing protein [Candidatus Saccharimonadales bacterium]